MATLNKDTFYGSFTPESEQKIIRVIFDGISTLGDTLDIMSSYPDDAGVTFIVGVPSESDYEYWVTYSDLEDIICQ